MKITILFDENAISQDLQTGFGLSLLVNDSVLFDTGADGDILCHNIKALNINTSKITTVVVSHEHWDHTGGLLKVLSLVNNPNIFVCRNFSRELKKELQLSGGKIHMADGFTKIAKNIYTTGEIYSTYKNLPLYEQSLVVTTPQNHAAVICGCCHYDLLKSIEMNKKNIASYFDRPPVLDCVIGGFHLKNETDLSLQRINKKVFESGIERMVPLHCSSDRAKKYFRENFEGTCYTGHVGSVFEL